MVMDSADWQEMFKRSQGEKQIVEVVAEDSREKKYAFDKLKRAAQEALKFL